MLDGVNDATGWAYAQEARRSADVKVGRIFIFGCGCEV